MKLYAQYKGLYDFNDDKTAFIQGADKKSITFSRDANDKKKIIIVLGKTGIQFIVAIIFLFILLYISKSAKWRLVQ